MLEANELTKSYDDNVALDRLNLKVNPGDIFCLLGANGAGKTTTINLFLGFVRPTGGSARVDGIDVLQNPEESRRRIAYIPEQVTLYGSLTGLENLAYFASLVKDSKYTKPEMIALLERSGLPKDAIHRQVKTYSKGMRQKIGIAIALAKKATVLLLDEPTSGLDPKASNEFSELLIQLSGDGVAILMATHDLFRAKESGTHVGIMKKGKLVAEMKTAEVNHADLERIYLDCMRD